MKNNAQFNPRQQLEDLIEKQGGNSLENCNLEFLGYKQGLQEEIPRPDFAHLGAYKKGYISALNYLYEKELRQNSCPKKPSTDTRI